MQPRSEAEAERLARFGLTKDQLLTDISAFVTAWGNPARAANALGISPDALFNARGGTADVPLAVFQDFYVLGSDGSSSRAARGPNGTVERVMLSAEMAEAVFGEAATAVVEPDTSAADARAFAAATGAAAVDRSDRLPAAVKAEDAATPDFGWTGAEICERGGLAVETLRADLLELRDCVGKWSDLAAMTDVGKSYLANVALGHASPGAKIIAAFYETVPGGTQLVLQPRWVEMLELHRALSDDRGTPAPAALPRESTSPQRGEVAGVPFASAETAVAAAIANAVAQGSLNGKPVPLERAAAEAARFDKNIEDDGFVTVRPVLSPPAGSAVVEGAGADTPALVGSAVDAGVAASATGDPADGAGEAPPVASPAQPVVDFCGDIRLSPADRLLPRVEPQLSDLVDAFHDAALARPSVRFVAHTADEPLFANPSPHTRQAGPNVVQHVAGGDAIHWRWKMRASMNMQLTSLLAKQAAAQDALDELNEAIKALRVLRAIGDELPEPDEDFVAAMVRSSTEAQVAA